MPSTFVLAAETGVNRDLLDWVIVVSTLVALALTILQLIRVGRVAKAASTAVRKSEIRLANSTLSGDFPRLQDLEQSLRAAVESQDRSEIRRLVVSLRYDMARIAGILKAQRPGKMANPLQKSINGVRDECRQSLDALESNSDRLAARLTYLLNNITKAMDELSEHLGEVGLSGEQS